MNVVKGAHEIPGHVRSAFGVGESPARPVTRGSGTGLLVDGIVLSTVSDNALANWSARIRSTLAVPGLTVAGPVRARDGRHVVDGWRADQALPGRPEGRPDETIRWSFAIADALADVEPPRIVHRPSVRPWSETDLFGFAERAAWDGNPEVDLAPGMEDQDEPFEKHRAAALLGAGALIRHRQPVTLENRLVHGDLAHGLLYNGSGAPGLADVVPFHRPAEWSAAVVAVDHLSWRLADPGLLHRWSHLEEWPQMLLRAAVFRLCVHALHPGSTEAAFGGLEAMAGTVENIVREHGQ